MCGSHFRWKLNESVHMILHASDGKDSHLVIAADTGNVRPGTIE